MDARAIITRIRNGQSPLAEELSWFAHGLASGRVSDAQAGAFAMAVLLRGLSEPARVALTLAMRDSGRVMAWDLPGPAVDKHSTGGIGDCVSLLLAPALAACGAYVPMISGRGLGHTGGTLDKLEAIPGFHTDLSEEAFRDQVASLGCAIVAASRDLAPADRRLYAVRDVSATVESLDLITASILSKKLAAGLDALVLDVKCGSGAFMKTRAEAEALAKSLVSTAQDAGCMTSALITDMDRPLVRSAGNALEVIEVMQALTGAAGGERLIELSARLGGEVLALSGLAGNSAEGTARLRAVLADGRAAENFGRMVRAQGGPGDFPERWRDRLPAAAVVLAAPSPETGQVLAVDGEQLGHAVVRLGGGRLHESDRISHGVGLSELIVPGEAVARGQPLALVHASGHEAALEAVAAVQRAFLIGAAAARDTETPLILQRIG